MLRELIRELPPAPPPRRRCPRCVVAAVALVIAIGAAAHATEFLPSLSATRRIDRVVGNARAAIAEHRPEFKAAAEVHAARAELRSAARPPVPHIATTRLGASLAFGPPANPNANCSRLFVYNMHALARFGFGSQLANYLMAFAAARQLDRELVVVGRYTLGCDGGSGTSASGDSLTACLVYPTSHCAPPPAAILDLSRCYNRKRAPDGGPSCDGVQRRADGTTVLRCDAEAELLHTTRVACAPGGDAVRSVNILVAAADFARGFSYKHWAAYETTLLRGAAVSAAANSARERTVRIRGALCKSYSTSSPPACDGTEVVPESPDDFNARTVPLWPGWVGDEGLESAGSGAAAPRGVGAPWAPILPLLQDSEGGDCHRCARLRLFRLIARIALRWHPRFAHQIELARRSWAVAPRLSFALRSPLRVPFAGVHVRMGDALSTGRLVVTLQSAIDALRDAGARTGGASAATRSLFIATDDEAAARAQCEAPALVAKGWRCHFLAPTLVGAAAARTRSSGHLQHKFNEKTSAVRFESYARLMLELEVLIEADWFVATFESNLDSLVNALRTQPARTAIVVGGAHWIPAIR